MINPPNVHSAKNRILLAIENVSAIETFNQNAILSEQQKPKLVKINKIPYQTNFQKIWYVRIPLATPLNMEGKII